MLSIFLMTGAYAGGVVPIHAQRMVLLNEESEVAVAGFQARFVFDEDAATSWRAEEFWFQLPALYEVETLRLRVRFAEPAGDAATIANAADADRDDDATRDEPEYAVQIRPRS
jgi:hypothetical protein